MIFTDFDDHRLDQPSNLPNTPLFKNKHIQIKTYSINILN